jgi:hypothetical protein
MKTKIFIFTFLLILSIQCVFAQKNKKPSAEDKAAEKEWKKKLKELDPLQYRDLVNELNRLRGENGGLKNNLKTVGKELTDKDAEIARLQNEYDSINNAVAQAKKDAANAAPTTNPEYTKGTWYRVQVGVKNKIDISEVGGDAKNLIIEKDSDNIYKYTLGHFKDYWEADEFKKALRTIMGLDKKKEEDREIWTVIYKDNERASMKDRLQIESGNPKGDN